MTVLLFSVNAGAQSPQINKEHRTQPNSKIIEVDNSKSGNRKQQSANHDNTKAKPTRGGLRSDGELVQARRPSPVPAPYPMVSNKTGNKDNKKVFDAHDRFANQQTSAPKLIRLPLGAQCNKLDFPKNAVIERFGKRQAVGCRKSNVTLKRGKPNLKSGFTKPIDKKRPKKIIKKGGFGDEMPEDFPAG